MKTKTKEQYYKRRIKSLTIGLVTLAIFLVLMISLVSISYELKLKEKTDLLLFSVEMTEYCANQSNLSFENLSEAFLRNKMEDLITK